MRICAVVVTYGNRYHLLDRVIEALLQVKVSKIVVVDNNSHNESRSQLRAKELDLKELLTVIYLSENTGSAGGYKVGLEFVRTCKDCEFVWLLDDDNIPYARALEVLITFWNNFDLPRKEERLCLLSYREQSPAYKELARRDSLSIEPIIGSNNAVLGLNFLHAFSTRKHLKLFLGEFKEHEIVMKKNFGKVPVAPYGGMFFNKVLLDSIGYPDDRLFLYGDDYEYSHRIIKHSGEIILLLDSRMKDIDVSENKGMAVDERNLFRLYYSNRNHVYFQKSLSSNRLVFAINYLIYLLFLRVKKTFVVLFKKTDPRKISVLLYAIKDGVHGKLGKREDRATSDKRSVTSEINTHLKIDT